MHWTLKLYCERVVVAYGVILEGYSRTGIPFRNLSKGQSPSVAQMRTLIQLCTAKPEAQIYFRDATPAELTAAHQKSTAVCPSALVPTPAANYGYSNIGRHVPRYDENGKLVRRRYERNGPKSAKSIEESDDSNGGVVERGPSSLMVYCRVAEKKEVRYVTLKSGRTRPLLGGELSDDPISDSDSE